MCKKTQIYIFHLKWIKLVKKLLTDYKSLIRQGDTLDPNLVEYDFYSNKTYLRGQVSSLCPPNYQRCSADHYAYRPGASSIYLCERDDPFKFSIYAWYIKIAIAGSLAPVRLAWGPFLRVTKKWVYLCGADTKKLYVRL